MNLEDYEKKVFSQNGEDGITIKLIDMIYGEFKNFRNFVELSNFNIFISFFIQKYIKKKIRHINLHMSFSSNN